MSRIKVTNSVKTLKNNFVAEYSNVNETFVEGRVQQ